ncbi:MAG: starch-binding protein [Ruminococcus sp.]
MNTSKSSWLRKLLALALSALILFSVIPISVFNAIAATPEHADAVTVSVVDTKGNPVSNANVKYSVDSKANGDEYISKNEKTDTNGCVVVMSSSEFLEDDMTLTVSVTKEKYKQKNTIKDVAISSDRQDFKVTLESTVIDDITVIPTVIKYDGEEHDAATVSPEGKYDFEYKLDDQEWQKNMPKIKEVKEYSLSVRATKDGYDPYLVTVNPVISLNTIELDVTEYAGYFDKNSHPALDVKGIVDGDIVTYKLNDGEEKDTIPEIYDVGKYSVTVKVERYGYETYSKVFSNIEIIAKNVEGVTARANSYTYDGAEHDAVTVEGDGLEDNDIIEYQFESGSWQKDVPQIKDAGEYSVNVRITRKNYNQTEIDVYPTKAIIRKAKQTLAFNNAKYNENTYEKVDLDTEDSNNNIYDFSAIGDLSETENVIKYSVSDVNGETTEIAEIDENGQLTVKAAGSVKVTATKEGSGNYDTTSISFTLMITAPSNGLVFFDTDSIKYTMGTNEGVVSDLKAIKKNGNDDNGSLTYSIDKTNAGLSCDKSNGTIKVSNYGDLTSALLAEESKQLHVNVNVIKGEGVETIRVEKPEPQDTVTVFFTDTKKWGNIHAYYWGGSVTGIEYPGIKMDSYVTNGDKQDLFKCEIPKGIDGVVFNDGKKTQGNQTVDISKNRIYNNAGFNPTSFDSMKNGNKAWNYGTYTQPVEPEYVEKTYTKYKGSNASYIINISFADTPYNPYTLNTPTGNNGWYIEPLKVSVSDDNKDENNIPKYNISKTPIPADFKDSVEFNDQGENTRYVYLSERSTGGITAPIELESVRIDTVCPQELSIEYSDPINGWWENLISAITFGFYNPEKGKTIVTFTAKDVTSGVDHFNWSYTKEDGSSDSNLELIKDKHIDVVLNDSVATATLELPLNEKEQLRGNISFYATDKAGNVSDTLTDDNKTIVIDSISPECSVSYSDCKQTIGTQMYYDGDVTAKIEITEANFFKEDVKVYVSKNEETPYEVVPEWVDDSVDVHIGTFTISGDGDYKVKVEYTDKSSNEMESYTSDIITIDTTKPVVDFKYDKENQSTTFTVKEHNFSPENISVIVESKDINGNDVTEHGLQSELREAQWTNEGNDVYTVTVSDYVDAIYSLDISYVDPSLRESEVLTTEKFTIDHTGPTDVSISYSKPILGTILETITLGFYNPNVTVTFTAYDNTSGVDTFVWFYARQDGASEINRQYDGETLTVDPTTDQDKIDKSKFTKTIVLEVNEAEQLRGSFSVRATDKFNNNGEKIDNENVIVVDTIAPEMSVEFSEASRTAGKTMYYGNDKNGKAIVTFNVNEANFYSEDVKVSVSKNGGDKKAVSDVVWTDKSVDEHTGVYTISGDGHYVVYVDYTDRSNNKMTSYISDTIIIDTKKPVITVEYDNEIVIEKLSNSKNHNRSYFDDEQKATVTIKEHNFNAKEVKFRILAKDVNGNPLDNTYKMSKWKSNGDEHTIKITYSGDANYTFDIDYTDLANNEAKDYNPDYFAVDKTAPTDLKVSYSKSVLDTTLETLTFGFYKAKVTVTLSARDNISKVNKFDYSYINAKNVSPVNAELLDQIIKKSSIKYDKDDKGLATTTFTIPKDALGDDNQFNGTVAFVAYDRSGNSTKKKDTKRIVVDNIAPNAQVEFDSPVKIVNGVSYYDGSIESTIVIDEANFYEEDVKIRVSKDGHNYPVTARWDDSKTDVHTGTFTLEGLKNSHSGDGRYVVYVDYKDKSNNAMKTYKSDTLVIDTTIETPIIAINGNKQADGTAYKDEVIPSISFSDENLENYQVKLTRTRFGEKNIDVTDEFIGGRVSSNKKGGSGTFDTFKKIAENDGIYTLTVKVSDMADHSSESTVKFTVNRFGSVYGYNKYLAKLIKDGGAYTQNVKEDLVVTEYNADRLLANSLDIEVTRDGKPIDNLKYTATPAINKNTKIGSSGWYQYKYIISKDNFNVDGIYKITVSSKDATGNSPENNNYDDKVITFRVDSTAPEITSVVGLEESIINAQEVNGKYTVYDTIGLESITIYIDGEKYGKTITDFKKDLNNYIGEFILKEKSSAQSVRIVVKDLAGNVTDTDAKAFSSEYEFNKAVTVSTNFFVRWFANAPLFWGSIGSVAVIAGAILFIIVTKHKKKEKK